ncbi:lasso peptide biosynthesis B2 protein [Parafrankia sp. BMG5.11]|uniref:lasso peptide biosynthesis B2 protein n=1 Tax=Parafrankia sp. BMG5.11 TaxID=222540 RepID=UPI0035A0763F
MACLVRARPGAGRVAAGPDQANKIARVIESCAARSPLCAKCFEQGLAAVWLLRRAKYSATVHYGVARMDDKVVAHVWVLSGDQPVVGCTNRHAFAELARFPTT